MRYLARSNEVSDASQHFNEEVYGVQKKKETLDATVIEETARANV